MSLHTRRDLIRTISKEVERHLGAPAERVHIIHTLAGRAVAEVEVGGRSVYFKGLKREHESHLETWTTARVAALGVPVPEIIAVDRSKLHYPNEYLILAKVDGPNLGHEAISDETRRRLLAETGEYLRAMHSVTGSRFSNLSGAELAESGRPVGWAATWKEACLAWLHEIDKAVDVGVIEEAMAASVRAAVDRHLQVIEATDRSNLLHGDLGVRHIIVDPEATRVKAIIDFADVCLGDPIWDFARFLGPGPDLDALMKGYRPDLGMAEEMAVKVPLYRMLWHIGALVWCYDVGLTDLGWATEVIGECLSRL